MKKVAIIQSNYIPWKGYFDVIASVDEFIVYDDVQFTKNDWRNRNKIKTPKGIEWITIPVGQDIGRCIRDVKLINNRWQIKHWKTLESNYGKAKYFNEIARVLKPLYLDNNYATLSEVNISFIRAICKYLQIKTKISNSVDYKLIEGKNERLVDLCIQAKATEYVSGPAAKDYLNEELFKLNGIDLSWADYSGYSEYDQLWGEFKHEVSILDLLFNCGQTSSNHMKYLTHEQKMVNR